MLPAKHLSELLPVLHSGGLTRTASSPALSFHDRYSHSATAKSSCISKTTVKDPYQYQFGFGNRFVSEALWVLSRSRHSRLSLTESRPGVLPVAQNSPQRVKYGLYAEEVSNVFIQGYYTI